jgi:hypothetical protein
VATVPTVRLAKHHFVGPRKKIFVTHLPFIEGEISATAAPSRWSIQIQSLQAWLFAGLPDFSCYNEPKRENYTKKTKKIYQIAIKYTKLQ